MSKNSRGKSLVINTIIVAIGQICTKLISFFLLPLYTALLTPNEYGIFDLLTSYISLLIPLAFFQMEQAIFRFLVDIRDNDDEKKKLISTSLITITLQTVIFIIIYLIIGTVIKSEYKIYFAMNIIASMYAGNLLQISRGQGYNLKYSIGSLIAGAGTVSLNVIFITVLKFGVKGLLLANFIGNCMCIIYLFVTNKLYKYIKIKYFNKNILKELWKYSIPLVPNQLSWWIVTVSDRTIINFILNEAAVGIYAAANKFSGIIITFFNIFNMTFSESAALHLNDKDSNEYFSRVINITITLFSIVCTATIITMPFLFKFLIVGDGYSAAYYHIPILLVSTIFNICVSLLGCIYVALKKTKKIAKTSIYSAIINIIVNLILIKSIGLFASSISTLLSYFAMAIYRYFDVQKYVQININKRDLLLNSVFIFISLILYYLKNTLLLILFLILLTIYAIYFLKKLLLNNQDLLPNKLRKFINKKLG